MLAHVAPGVSVWEAVAVIAASVTTVGVVLTGMVRWAWHRIVKAQLDQIKQMLQPNGMDTAQVGDSTARLERDLATGMDDLAAKIDARAGELRSEHIALREEVRDNGAQIGILGGRFDQHLDDATRDKENLWRELGRVAGRRGEGPRDDDRAG